MGRACCAFLHRTKKQFPTVCALAVPENGTASKIIPMRLRHGEFYWLSFLRLKKGGRIYNKLASLLRSRTALFYRAARLDSFFSFPRIPWYHWFYNAGKCIFFLLIFHLYIFPLTILQSLQGLPLRAGLIFSYRGGSEGQKACNILSSSSLPLIFNFSYSSLRLFGFPLQSGQRILLPTVKPK